MAILPSAAVQLGERLEKESARQTLKWARTYAKRHISNTGSVPPTAEIDLALAAAFPKSSVKARRLGQVLVWYVAYRQSAKAEATASSLLHEREKDLRAVEDEVHNPPAYVYRGKARGEAQRTTRLIDAQRSRDQQKLALEVIRARVDGCLRSLAAVSEGLSMIEVAEIRELQ